MCVSFLMIPLLHGHEKGGHGDARTVRIHVLGLDQKSEDILYDQTD